MSEEIQVKFEVRSMPIMKATLEQMGVAFEEIKADILSIKRPYHNIVINGVTGEVSFDQENKRELDIITQNYQTAWYKDKFIREGIQFTEEVVEGVVYLYAEN